jgi:bifunctional non-homologous end joining protein LigD
MSLKSISLYYKDGKSDKVYHTQIEQEGVGFIVNFQYGRRGATLTGGTKTKEPVNLDVAERAFESLVKEKMGKGYTVGEDGAIFTTEDLGDRVTGIFPQLLNEVEEEDLEEYFLNPNWLMQEKYDGRRLLIKKSSAENIAINKKGLAIFIVKEVMDLIKSVPVDIVVDGEIIGNRYYIFDILEYNGIDLRSKSVQERYDILKNIEEIKDYVVASYVTEEGKRDLFKRLKEDGKEGVVFKEIHSTYIPGRPSSGGNQIKFKFWKSATVVVDSIHKTKRSVGVAVYRQNEKVLIGNVTISTKYNIPSINEIVEVVYLYCTQGDSLYQSKYKGIRDDQVLSDCLYSQLKFKATVDEDED